MLYIYFFMQLIIYLTKLLLIPNKNYIALTGNRTRAICLEGKYSTSILLTLSLFNDAL